VSVVVVSLAAACAGGSSGGGRGDAASGAAAGSNAAVAQHRSLLADLAGRVVPAVDGGWVVAAVDDLEAEAPDRWTLAAVAGDLPDAEEALAAALGAASREAGGDPELARRAAQAAALALADPTAPSAPPAVVVALAQRAVEEFRHGGGGWLGVVLNLALTEGRAGEISREHLSSLAGGPSCDRLPAVRDPLPGPDGALTVPLRLLAASGLRCHAAAHLLERSLGDPAWAVPIAAAPLADLLTVAGDVEPAVLDQVADRLSGWFDPEGPAVVDLAVAMLLRRSAAAIGRPLEVPEHVALRLRNVAARHGVLPDRSSSPTTALDVAILRQLRGAGFVSDALAASARAVADRDAAPLPDVVNDLFIDGTGPGCDDVLPSPGRVGRSIGTALGEVVVEVGRLHCAGTLSWAIIGRLVTEGRADEAPVRAWAAVLAACHLDPSVIDGSATIDLELTGPFHDDPVWLVGAAMAVAPRAACDAERDR
jgi:hypothetical protein